MGSSTKPSTPTDHAAMPLPAGALVRPSLSVGTVSSLRTGLESIPTGNPSRTRPNARAADFGRERVVDEFAARLLLPAHMCPLAEDTALATSSAGAILDSQRQVVCAQGDVIDTTTLHFEVAAPPIRAKKQIVLPLHGLDLAEEERQRIEIVLNAGGGARRTGRRSNTMGRAPVRTGQEGRGAPCARLLDGESRL
jgi:hypothetical protein